MACMPNMVVGHITSRAWLLTNCEEKELKSE